MFFQVNEVERHITAREEEITRLQKQHNIPADWLKAEFDARTHDFATDATKEAYQNIKRYQADIRIYLNKIGLSRDMLRTMTMDINTCGTNIEDIKMQFIEAHIGLVVNLTKKCRYRAPELEFLDLIQEGNIGLMKAIDNFDYQRGYQFKTYATWWIRQRLSRITADQDSK